MTTPLNISSPLPTAAAFGSTTLPAGFVFTAGRHAVVQLTHYQADDTPLGGITVGGTEASRVARAPAGGQAWAEIWVANGIVGGTDDVVFTYGGSSTHNYVSAVVTEWAAEDGMVLQAGTVNTVASGATSTSSAQTSVATAGPTVTFAVLALDAPGDSDTQMVATGSWSTTLDVQNHSATVCGLGSYFFAEDAGVQEASFTHDSWPSAIAVASFAIADEVDLGGSTSVQSSTSAAGAATQTHNLSGAGSNQPSSSTAGAVAVPVVVQGEGAKQGATSSAGGVGQEHALSGDVTSQPGTSTASPVVQVFVLAGEGSAQKGTSSSGPIDTTATLSALATVQPSTSSAGAVGQTHALQGAASVQPSTTAGGAIVREQTLQAQGAVQGATSSGGSVDTASMLAGDGASQRSTSTAGAVAQTRVLGGSVSIGPSACTGGSATQALAPTEESGEVLFKPDWPFERTLPTLFIALERRMGDDSPWGFARRVPRFRLQLTPLVAGAVLLGPLSSWNDDLIWNDQLLWDET